MVASRPLQDLVTHTVKIGIHRKAVYLQLGGGYNNTDYNAIKTLYKQFDGLYDAALVYINCVF